MQVARIGVAFALRAAADLHHELARRGELEELVVADGLQSRKRACGTVVSAHPHVTFVVDVYPVLALGPFETGAGAAPCAQEVAGGVEHEYRRRCGLAGFERARTMKDVD